MAVHRVRIFIREHLGRLAWQVKRRPMPPSQSVKNTALRSLRRRHRLRVFVETGTYAGTTLSDMAHEFDVLYSIELGQELYEKALERFADRPHVHLIHGDSAVELPKVVEKLREPALFWLDGHYSGAGTVRGDVDTPIVSELAAILASSIRGHVIAIDDADDFTGKDGYPAVAEIKQVVGSRATVVVRDNMIQIRPSG